jgi:AraC-like DNA-binding protein
MANMIDKLRARDIVPMFSGYERCKNGHKFGPRVRSHYLIHFCLKGKGKLFDKFGEHDIGAGKMFIIRPGEITIYVADDIDPWEYSWIAFEGEMADVFDTERSVYEFPIEIGERVQKLTEEEVSSPSVYISLIYSLIYATLNEEEESTDIIKKIKRYIKFNYMNDISVIQLSEYFGFERSYFYRMFKKHSGISVKEYILKTRMEQAKLLLNRGYSVGNTAYAVGYNDQSNFSKAFKKYYGRSPKDKNNG